MLYGKVRYSKQETSSRLLLFVLTDRTLT